MVDRFPTESNFQDDLSSKRVFSYKFVSAVNTSKKTLHQINAGNTHVVIQSSCPGVLTGENYMDVGTIFEA